MPVERKYKQHIAYLAYGEASEANSRTPLKTRQSSEQTFFERRDYWNTPYKFNAKELDDELRSNRRIPLKINNQMRQTGMYYYGARYYTPEVSIWLSVDPLADKYPDYTPYAYCYNNPINVIDLDGREGIVVSGGEYDGDRYKYNFIEPAITRLNELKAASGDEPITWVVMTAGYSDADIEVFESIAEDLGVGFQPISSADEFTNYLNSKDKGNSNLSSARNGDQITSMTVFGHGSAGSAEFAYNQNNQASFSWSLDDVKQLEKGAFNNASIHLYTCYSATNTTNNKSLGYTLSAWTGSSVIGYRGQSTYRHMNKGESWGAKVSRKWNGFAYFGSEKMPQAGEGAKEIKFVPKKK